MATRNCELFAGIQVEHVAPMLKCLGARKKKYAKGDFIFHAGESVSYVGVVVQGAISLVQEDYWGNRSLLEHVGEGGLFGEAFACVDNTAVPMSAIALEDVEVLQVDYKRIITTCSSECAFHLILIKNMLACMAKRNIALMRKIEHISKRSINDKVLSYLSAQAMRHDAPSFEIPFSRQEFADYLSVDRASLSRALGSMRKEGLIDVKGRHFELL
ncbi:MAG: Crp/Fnr family transcriptional regulator [Raoultibacter sp.]|jgi:CRP-like cAMP-binding protein